MMSKQNFLYFLCLNILFPPFDLGKEIMVAIDSFDVSRPVYHNVTLSSAEGKFLLGFLDYGGSTRFYLGIWYNVFPTQVIWVANKDNPLNDTSGVLTIRNDGNLVLRNGGGREFWSTNLQNSASGSVSAQLLDTGNLVLKDNNGGSFLWQSFDHPSHATVAGMKLGWDLRIGLDRNLTSWKSSDDPAAGEYTYGIALEGLPQIVIWRGSSIQYRSGPWNGVNFGNIPLRNDLPYTLTAVINDIEVYYQYHMVNNSSDLASVLTNNGELRLLLRDNDSQTWRPYYEIPEDECSSYGYCGPNAICYITFAERCRCMTGYKPKSQQQWDISVWSGGCELKEQTNCTERQHFLEMRDMKMPEFLQYQVNKSMSLEECRAACLKDCSCTAYANAYVSGQPSGCLRWLGDLTDVRPILVKENQTLFLRISESDLVSESGPKNKNKITIIVVTMSALVCLLSAVLFFIWRRKVRNKGGEHSK
ncbi:hypothetical protein Leryth_026850 [Lithospermum erythrorhizon]|nr:hypothetical protein Leryth_026850 [Lithospermum erythrorhizon]